MQYRRNQTHGGLNAEPVLPVALASAAGDESTPAVFSWQGALGHHTQPEIWRPRLQMWGP